MELNARLKEVAVNTASLLILLLLGWLDYITGYEFGFFIFYFIPVSITAWFSGGRCGIVMAVASGASWFLSDKLTHHPYPNAYFIYWETFMRLASFLTTAFTVSRIRRMIVNERHLNAELKRALQEISHLKGCSPDDKLYRATGAAGPGNTDT